jgi:YcaO-like protein with predicted kinase domain
MLASTERSASRAAEASASSKTYFDGTHRTRAPEATWLSIKPHFKRLGITRVAVITGLDVVGIPVVMVARPNARSLSVSQGKGVDLCCARVSGAMESIEQHCAEHLDLPMRHLSWIELQRHQLALSPTRVPALSAWRLEGRMEGRSEAGLEHRPLLWVEGTREPDREPCWLPYGLVHLDLRRPLAPGSELFPPSSNGLASGNTRSEALVHAVLEVIERDAWARFVELDADERQRRTLDLSTVTDQRALEMIARLRRAGSSVRVWDLSGELGVACFLCHIVEGAREWAFQVGRAEGLGCHTHSGIALVRAVCEAAQSRLCAIAGSRDDMTRASVARIRDPLSIQRAQREIGDTRRPDRDFQRVATRDFDSFEAELEWLTQRLASWVGAEVFCVDIPSQGVPIHVVRAVVTNLRAPHFLSKQPPRRSFDAPFDEARS